MTSFNVVMHSFATGFEPFQQGLLVVNNVYNEMTMSLQLFFLFVFFSMILTAYLF